MINPEMPEDWTFESYDHIKYGCLRVFLTYRDEVAYVVTWHVDDVFTITARTADGTEVRCDPFAVAMAVSIMAEFNLSPHYPRDTAHHN